MKFLVPFLLAVSIFFTYSCGSSSTTTTTKNPHIDAHKKVHEEFVKEEVSKIETNVNKELEDINLGYQKIMQKKYTKGIDFYAIGNEPFWSLSIDFQKNMLFNRLGEEDFIVPVMKSEKIEQNIVKYHSKVKSGEIIVRINKSKCIDNMSGQIFTHSVNLEYKNNTSNDFQNLQGCGNYVPDYRLHNIWVVKKMNEKKLNSDDFKNGLPRIEFNMNKSSIVGFDGCNHFNGGFDFEPGKLNIGPLMSTMMACDENKNNTQTFNQILTKKDLTYKFLENYLEIYHNNVKVLMLKNVD